MKSKSLVLVLFLIVLIGIGSYLFLKDNPIQDSSIEDFPYVIKDGQVYCVEELRNILIDEIVNNDLLLDFADADTFRRPTQPEIDEAMTKGRGFVIDAVDKNNFYYQCSWINFLGTI